MTLLDDIGPEWAGIITPGEFGISATYKPIVGSSKIVNVIFWDGFHEGHTFRDAIDTMNPYIQGMEADFDGIKGNDTIEIDSATYYVTGYEPDGTGMIKIILSKDPQ